MPREFRPRVFDGATGAPTSEVELEMLFHAMAGRLERSDIVREFLTTK
jgi:hypothetical protein